jgi:alanyl-tRNA synthetase
MTDRLYYRDPYLRTFDATVEKVEPRGDRWSIALDRTAFYPTTGGQPFDTGTLGGVRVVDVVDEDDGTISHLVDATPDQNLTPGAVIQGEVDWARRFDHMQQHTGQHVLSAAILSVCRARTVSFHLGAAVSTIDLERELSSAEIAAAETEANRVVWEDRPVTIRFVSSEEAAALPLRKEPARGGTLRLIEVEGFDLSACGGTHVARSGAIGIIAVSSWERFKGGQRLEFLCGGRALGRWRSFRNTIASSVRLLSVLPEEIPATVERMQGDAREQKRAAAAWQTELATFRGRDLAEAAESIDGTSAVLRAVDADANGLKALATAVAAASHSVVVLVSTTRPALVVAARSSDAAVSAQQIIATLTGKFGGRGGGKPDLAQAGGLDASADDILAAARAMLFEPRA